VVAQAIAAAIDVPPFDRSLVDGFAVRAADLIAASGASPICLRLNYEIIACGISPAVTVSSGTATPIATGGPIPRGADAVVMIEQTEPTGPSSDAVIAVRRAVSPGQFVGFAGSDIVRGETLLRPGTLIGSREIGMLAACGLEQVEVFRRPRVGVISTGDELVAQGKPLRAAAIYDSNGPIISAAVAENGGTAFSYGAIPDEETALRKAIKRAFSECDMIILSGGTSKGAGDLTYRLIAGLGAPGIVAHGVALKPGKPLCLAVCDGKPVIVLPGFPTSAMFTFHDVVAPVLRRLAGLPERSEAHVSATVPVRVSSEIGRTEFVMVSLVEREGCLVAYPVGKGSGSVTAFSQADGFVAIDALAEALPAGAHADVTLFSPYVRSPDLVIIGSHCIGIDAVVNDLAASGQVIRLMAVGSFGGLAAARRGECDLAPIHLLDPKTGLYNQSYLTSGLELVEGWQRMQGLVFRKGDPRFDGLDCETALAGAVADPDCHMVNHNQGAGTRILIDKLLDGAKPTGYWNQPRSHNSVAAAVAQGRADWGVAITPVAEAYGLGFIPLGEEHYDFALVSERRSRPAVMAFLDALDDPAVHADLRRLGFRRAGEAW
jgi:molybdenum cofactor synthesis domain-containing protein